MGVFSFVLVLILSVISWIFKKKYGKYSKLPPGPPALPIIGSIPFLDRKKGNADATLHKSFYKQYPDIYTLWLGSKPLLVIQNFNLAKDLFAREEFSGRGTPSKFHLNYIRGKNGQPLGIVSTTGSIWQEQRRFALRHLKDLGFGKQKLDVIIQDESKYLIDDIILKSNDGDLLFDEMFNFPIINILWQIVASKRYDANLPKNKKMMENVTEFFKTGYPPLAFLWVVTKLRDLCGHPLFRMDHMMLDLKAIFRSQVQEHLRDFDSGGFGAPRDFIDLYLKEIKQREKLKSSNSVDPLDTFSSFNIEQLITICFDFFQAGADTSSTTLSWAVLYLTLYPEVQKKCRSEIDQNLGDRLPTKDDSSKLVYCVATIQEIQRVSCVAPSTLIHSPTHDVEVKGYKIPKDTMIAANLAKFMMDPEVFPEPKKLLPDRFIEHEGNKSKLKKIKQFVPFGFGKRGCPGESFTGTELMIFFVMLLQRLSFDIPTSHSPPNADDYFGDFTRIPKPFYVSVTSR